MRTLIIFFALSFLALSTQAAKTPKPPKVAVPNPKAGTPTAMAKSDFRRTRPCPSTGRDTGTCPGYVIGYLTPLICGGPDTAPNMQWQTPEAAKAASKAAKSRCESKAK